MGRTENRHRLDVGLRGPRGSVVVRVTHKVVSDLASRKWLEPGRRTATVCYHQRSRVLRERPACACRCNEGGERATPARQHAHNSLVEKHGGANDIAAGHAAGERDVGAEPEDARVPQGERDRGRCAGRDAQC